MSQTNFLIGRGELLTHDTKGPKRKPGKAEVYSLHVAKRPLLGQFKLSVEAIPTGM